MYDVIVIGAGHNGLVTAVTLSQAGYKVLVLEQRAHLGGVATTEEIFPGYQINVGAHDAALLSDQVVQALFLRMYGLAWQQNPVTIFAPQPDGTALTLWHDTAKNLIEISGLSREDARQFPVFKQEVEQIAQVLQQIIALTPPDLTQIQAGDLLAWGKVGLHVKRLGDKEMMTLLRVLPMPISTYLNEWFESDALKGVLGAIGVTGSRQGPRAAGTTLTFLYQQLGGFLNHRFLVGGIGQLATVLAEAAKQHDTEIRTQTAVTRIVLQDGRAIGVETDAGDIIKANIIISNADPKRTFLQLVGAPNLPPRFVRQVRAMLYRGSTAKVNLALSDLPQFNGQTETTQLGGHIRISPSLDYVERAYDAAKYGRFSEKPVLDMTIPTLHDATLAPDGRHILSITMQYAPYKLRNSTWETQREVLGDTIMNTVAQYAPNIKACILHRQILTPLDWETTYSLTEGSIFHGQMGLDQLFIMRPLPSWAQYSTPIDNLYLCGAGTHPGGGVTGIPGYNAAQKVLQELS